MAILFFDVILLNSPWLKIVQLLICCSPRRTVQELTTIKPFVAISLRLGGILTGLESMSESMSLCDRICPLRVRVCGMKPVLPNPRLSWGRICPPSETNMWKDLVSTGKRNFITFEIIMINVKCFSVNNAV